MPSMPLPPRSSSDFHQQVRALQERYHSVLNQYHQSHAPYLLQEAREWGDILESYINQYGNEFN